MEKKYILSTCGVSLLTNQTQDKQLVFRNANAKKREDVPEPDREQLETLIRETAARLEDFPGKAGEMSAELSTIKKIYSGAPLQPADYHELLCSDTWLCEEAAKIAEQWLRKKQKDMGVTVHRHRDLQTQDLASFQLSLSDLVRKLSNELPGYAQQQYTIIFNLTGGFKAVQGFMQSIAHFFADETVYIFEGSSELMKIPRLPIRLDATGVVEKNITVFRNLAMGLPVARKDLTDIPETLLFTLGGETALSPWGELVWATARDEIYQKGLLPSPNEEKIRFGEKFAGSVGTLTCKRMKDVNYRIDQLNRYFVTGKANLSTLDFKQIKANPKKNLSTHEIDAWSVKGAKRIFGHFEGSVFVLDLLAEGLH